MYTLTHFFPVLKPGGGPSGYLYNLYTLKKASEIRRFDVSFFKVITDRVSLTINDERFSWIMKFPLILRKVFVALYYLMKLLSPVRSFTIYKKVKKYECVVFHSFFDFINYYIIFSKFKNQKMLYMPHSPEMHYQEIMSSLSSGAFNISSFPFLKNILKVFEKKCFIKADALLFPTEFSYEGYEKEFLDIILNKKKIFIPSTVVKFEGEENEIEELRDLSPDKCNVLYVGRFNEVKGFDVFIRLASSFGQKYNFICVGVGPLETIIPNNVLNLGWRSDIFSILRKADYVVVPNKKTYFDLLPIEALSCGCSLLLSNVGGNKYLIEKGRGRVSGFSNEEELHTLMSALNIQGSGEREKSLKLYRDLFSTKTFLEKHGSIYKAL